MHEERAETYTPSRLGSTLADVLRNPTPEQLRQLVESHVAAAGRTDEARAAKLSASRPTLDRWRKSGDVKLSVLAKLAEASGEAIILRFDPDPDDIAQQAPPPEWARELTDEIREEIAQTRELVVSSLAVRTAEALEPHLQQLLDALARLDDHPGA